MRGSHLLIIQAGKKSRGRTEDKNKACSFCETVFNPASPCFPLLKN